MGMEQYGNGEAYGDIQIFYVRAKPGNPASIVHRFVRRFHATQSTNTAAAAAALAFRVTGPCPSVR